MMIKNFGKDLAKAFFIGILIFLIVSLIQYVNGYNVFTSNSLGLDFALNQLYSVVLYLTNGFFVRFLIIKYEKDLFIIKNLLIGVFGGIGITLASLVLLRLFTKVVIFEVSLSQFIANEKIEYYYYYLLCFLLLRV
jgi:hypothetical protein